MDNTYSNVIVAGAVGLIIAAVLWWKFRKEIQFMFRKTRVEGTITNWLGAIQDGKRVYYPMIEFESAEKGKITFRAEEMCEGAPLYDPGTKVTVVYLPGDVEMRKVIYPS
jgi:hypothetical protein